VTSAGRPVRPLPTVRSALVLLRRQWRSAYLAAVAAPWSTPCPTSSGNCSCGATRGCPAALTGALVRGTGLAWTAVRTAPGTVAAGVVLGGAVSALLTVPASVAAIGLPPVLGPLHQPTAGGFAIAALSDAVASAVTLPFLALVLVLAGQARLTQRVSEQ
jgi:hypothetical protein